MSSTRRPTAAELQADRALEQFGRNVGNMGDAQYLQMVDAILKKRGDFVLNGQRLDTRLQYDPVQLARMGETVRNPDGSGPGHHARAVTNLLRKGTNESLAQLPTVLDQAIGSHGQATNFIANNPVLQNTCQEIGGTLKRAGTPSFGYFQTCEAPQGPGSIPTAGPQTGPVPRR